jgi:hypothetical protein
LEVFAKYGFEVVVFLHFVEFVAVYFVGGPGVRALVAVPSAVGVFVVLPAV